MKLSDRFKLYVEGYRDPFSRGECYEFGRHVDVNIEQAFVLYRQAMHEGDPRAYFRMAKWHQTKGDLSKALKAYYEGAIRGHEPSRESLVELFESDNVDAALLLGHVWCERANWQEAIFWYKKAAEKKHPEALYCLGKIYQKGDGAVKKEIKQAFRFFREAAEYGSKHALNELSEKAFSKNESSNEYAMKSEACFQLACLYESGKAGLAPKRQKALTLYTQASAMNHAQASFRLGELEEEEKEPDYPTAYRHYALAACQNHVNAKKYLEKLASENNPDAQYALGFHYYHEQGDISNAAHWCVKAHKQGHRAAIQYLMQVSFDVDLCLQIARQYEEETSQPSHAITFYKKASDVGDADASFRLAELYETEDVGPDYPTAYRYYAQAACQNHPEARLYLEQKASDNDPEAQYALGFYYYREQKNISQAVDWCVKAHLSGHAKAVDYVTQMHFSASVYLQIAHQYESDKTDKHTSLVIDFYKKASELRDASASFNLAQLYENGKGSMEPDPLESARYYVIAIGQKHPDARAQLERLASSGSAEAQYALGYCIYHKQGDTSRAARWCVKAHLLGHDLAWKYLTQTYFRVSVCLQIASQYETDGSPEQIRYAMYFYEKASSLGNARASFRLGQLHETEHKGLSPDTASAYRYYALAAAQKHVEAKTYLKELAESNNPQAQYALGFHYYRKQGNIFQAAHWCAKAHLLGQASALDYLIQANLSASSCLNVARQYESDGRVQHIPLVIEFYKKASEQGEALASFQLARWYETGYKSLKQDSKAACVFYLLAIKQNHPEAAVQLEAMAAAGDAQAQYAVGYHLCHQKGDKAQAVRWCVKAEQQGHRQAADYLTRTSFQMSTYLQIAKQYEAHKTDRVKNHRKALVFYSRATQQNDQNALFTLAQWYELDHPGMKHDFKQAFDHYLKAAQQGHPDAWSPLERLGQYIDAQRQRKLGELYGEFYDDEKQAYWFNQAGDVQGLRLLKR